MVLLLYLFSLVPVFDNNNVIVEIRIEDVFTRYINLPDQEREQ
jgi:hypothetical protein